MSIAIAVVCSCFMLLPNFAARCWRRSNSSWSTPSSSSTGLCIEIPNFAALCVKCQHATRATLSDNRRPVTCALFSCSSGAVMSKPVMNASRLEVIRNSRTLQQTVSAKLASR